MMIKLKLNLCNKDLGYHFGISESLVSHYICTWICFLYQHLKEIDWTPSPQQVSGTLPQSFHDKYPTPLKSLMVVKYLLKHQMTCTFSHLHTWSSYKHHNTAKFLIACTPNEVISFLSPVYVSGISDVELTWVSGFLKTFEGKHDILIMADRGFTMKNQLGELSVELTLFRLPYSVATRKHKKGCSIASLQIRTCGVCHSQNQKLCNFKG